MFERFTRESRAVVVAAHEHADRLGAQRIGTEHLLLSLASAPADSVSARALARLGIDAAGVERAVRSLGGAATLDDAALAAVGVDLAEVRRRVEATFGEGALDRPARHHGSRSFDRDAKKLLEVSLREAIHAQHRRIDTGHLLLAAVRLGDSRAHEALAHLGLRDDALRAAVTATWAERSAA